MRLGGPLFGDHSDPDKWVAALKKAGYGAAYCPVENAACDDVVNLYAAAAKKANIVIAEVGAWSNPMHPDEEKQKAALDHCKKQLDLAERIGARCCVNIAGSRGEQWDGALIRECFAKLGPHIRSCHAKDIALAQKLTTHLDEVRAGLGGMDYRVFLGELNKLEPDAPLMLDHLNTEEEYSLAAEHIRSVAAAEGLEFKA